MRPLVSIIIPTYNQQDFIIETISSAIEQTYQNLEIIVIDDNSGDNTFQIASSLTDSRLRIIRNSKNLGRVKNYQNGLTNHAKGDWILNLDGDDLLIDKNYISDCIEILENNHNLNFITCSHTKNDKLKGKRSKLYKVYDGKKYLLEVYKSWRFNHMTCLYNRENAIDVGFYNHNILSSDSDSMLKLCASGNVAVKNGIAGYWRSHEQNYTNNTTVQSLHNNYITISNSLLTYFKQNNFLNINELQILKKKLKIEYIIPIVVKALFVGEFKHLQLLKKENFRLTDLFNIIHFLFKRTVDKLLYKL
jgi:glycosyltransferase involved in cell wall biosynthesis